jgi:hypothetical protein
MRKGILAMIAMSLVLCMPLAAQRNNKNAGGASAAIGVPRGMSMSSPHMSSAGTTTRTQTHTVTNPAGSVTRTVTKSPSGSTRSMVNTEGNKTLTLTHNKPAGSRGTVTRTLTHVRKTARVKTAHRKAHPARARHTAHSTGRM